MPADVASASPKIGVVSTTVNPPISVINAAGQTRTVNDGDPIFLNDTINTPSRSYIKITLNDGTVFQLGPLAKAKLEKYSYISPTEGGEFEASIFTGFFRFVSGKISGDNQGQHTTLKTPAATIGIRGSEIDGSVNEDGSLSVVHVSGLIDITPHFATEPISVYERGTQIFIDNTHSVVSNATANEYKQFRDTLSPLDPNVHDNLLFVPPPMPIEPPPSFQAPQGIEKLQRIELSPEEKNLNLAEMSQQQRPEAPMIRIEGVDVSPEQLYRPNQLVKNPLLEQISERTPNYQLSDSKNNFLQDRVKDDKILKDESQVITIIPRKPIDETPIDDTNNTFPEDNSQTTEQILGVVDAKRDTIILVSPHGNVINNQNGSFTFMPESGWSGETSFIFRFANDPQLFEIQVKIPELLVKNLPTLTSSAEFLQPTHGTVYLTDTGQVEYIPELNFHGTDSFAYRETSDAPWQTVELTIFAVNDAPTVVADVDSRPELTVLEDTPLVISPALLLANDGDVDNSNADNSHLSVLKVTGLQETINDVVVFRTEGDVDFNRELNQIVFKPAADFFGETRWLYTIEDAEGVRSTAQVKVTVLPVDDAPKGGIDIVSMSSDESIISIAISELLKNDSDVENDPLHILAVNVDANNADKLSVSLNNDTVSVQLASDVKTGQFNYVLSDGQLETIVPVQVVRTGDIVAISNHAPLANNDTRTLGSLASLTLVDLLENDVDSDGDTLSILSINNVSNGTVTLLDTGTVIFNRSADFITEGSFSYTITDGQGNTAQATVTLTGSALLTAASALADIVQSQEPKGSTTSIDVATLLANDIGQNLQVIAVESANNGSVSLQDNKVNFTSLLSADTQGSFIYTIQDANGNISKANVTIQLADTSTVAPVAQADTFTVAKNTSLQFSLNDLLKNDTGTDLNATINSSSLTGGSLTQVGADGFIFTPTANFTGNASFNYTVTDNSGASSNATVTIAVQNTPPVAVNDTETTTKNETLTIPVQTLLSNDSDANGDSLTLATVSRVVNGSVRLEGDNVIFVPTSNFVGDASFSYTLQDSSQATAIAVVNITVTEQAVQAVDDALSMQKNTALNIPTASLLVNDISDNNATLKISAADNAVNGTVNFDSQLDKLVFTPATNFLGTASFTYTVIDAEGNTDTGQVNIKVIDNAPIAVTDAFTTQVTQSITIPYSALLSNDTDADKDILTVTTVDSARNGSITLGLNEVIFRPSADAANTIGGFSYTITDGTNTASTTVNIQIDANNQAPVAQNDEITLSYGTTVLLPTYDLLKNDTDANPLDTLSVSRISNTSSNVTATLSGDSIEVLVTPQFNSDGTLQEATFNYLASDGTTTSNTALVNLLADNVITGTRANDSFTPQATQIMTGLEGNDTFNGVQANNILHGNAGNDLFLFNPDSANGAVIAGDAGTDTLKLSSNLLNLGQNSTLSSDQQYQLTGIEVIDLTNTTGSTDSKQLILNVSDVLNITDNNILTILGDNSSIVNSIGYGWQKSDTLVSSTVDSSQRFVSYTKDSATLLVDSDISAQFIS